MARHNEDDSCPRCAEKLRTAQPTIAEWFLEAKKQFPDLHVATAFRGKEDQEKVFKEGKTRARFPRSKHNHTENGLPCALALDVFQLKIGKAIFSTDFLAELWQWTVAMGYSMKWGGNFKRLVDCVHFELL